MTAPSALTVGVDPGGRETGIVVLYGRDLLAAAVLDRMVAVDSRHGYRAAAWADANLEAIDRLLAEVRRDLIDADDEVALPARIIIEDVRAPNPHHTRNDGNALTNPDGILATAIVVGHVLARWPDAVIVDPGGHGARPRGSYPAAIELPRGGKGRDRLRHARSAYDIALTGQALAGRLHGEATRAARLVEPVLYRASLTV